MNIVSLWDVTSYNGHTKRLYIPGYLDGAWDTSVSTIIGAVYASSGINIRGIST